MKKIAGFLLTFVLTLAACIPAASPVSAADTQSPLVTLTKNTTYKQYDVTGDGKADTFRYSVSNEGKSNSSISVTINKKIVYTNTGSAKYRMKLCSLENGRVYLNLFTSYTTGTWQKSSVLLRYKSGALKQETILLDTASNRYQLRRSNVSAVKGDTITVTYVTSNNIVGTLNCKGTYVYDTKTKTMVRKSNTMPAAYSSATHANNWKVSKAFYTYTTTSCKTRSFRTKAGEVVQISRVYSTPTKLCLEILRANGTKGWVDSPKLLESTTMYFTNPAFTS